jgi:phytoene dehydrogenase-like protein
MRHCRFIRPLLMRTPPDPVRMRPRDLGTGLSSRRRVLGCREAQICDMIRFWTMSHRDYLDEHFETTGDQGLSRRLGDHRHRAWPDVAGHGLCALHHYMGDVDGNVGAWGFARGGMGAITRRWQARSRRRAARCARARASRVLIEERACRGSRWTNGEVIRGARRLEHGRQAHLPAHVDEAKLPEDFVRAVKRFKIRGSSGKLNIALDRRRSFPALPEGAPMLRGDLHFTDSVAKMERAYDDWKAGRWSPRSLFQT